MFRIKLIIPSKIYDKRKCYKYIFVNYPLDKLQKYFTDDEFVYEFVDGDAFLTLKL
jgi:hypothetical protein